MSKKRQIKPETWPTEQLVAAACDIPEFKSFLLQEGLTPGDLVLQYDDLKWGAVNTKTTLNDLGPDARRTQMTLARAFWRKDPMMKQAVRLWTDYCFGSTGLTYDVVDSAGNTVEDTNDELDIFFKARTNQRFLSAEGQQRSSRKLLVDGDLFIAIWQTDPIRIRYVEASQVTHIITDPDDDETIICYRRCTATGTIMFYRDWAATDEDVAKLDKIKDPETTRLIGSKSLVLNCKVLHPAFASTGLWGNSLIGSVIEWTNAHRVFMEKRVSITSSLAKFAWKTTVAGGQQILDAMKARSESSLVSGGISNGPEKNPVGASASTWLQSKGLNTEPMPRATGAGDAKADSDSLKLMVCAGVGIFLHYFGDPSTGNLATATAMELPMLKMFQGYQQFWKDVYRAIFAIVLDEDPDALPDYEVRLDLPPILAEDLQSRGTFITQLTTAFPEAKVPPVLRRLLSVLGIDDLDDVMDQIAVEKVKQDAQTAQDKKDALAGKAAGGVAQTATPEQVQQLADAFKSLAERLA